MMMKKPRPTKYEWTKKNSFPVWKNKTNKTKPKLQRFVKQHTNRNAGGSTVYERQTLTPATGRKDK